MDWLDKILKFRLADIKVEKSGLVIFNKTNIYNLHPETTRKFLETKFTPEQEAQIRNASTEKLSPIGTILDALPEETRDQVVAATVFNSSLDAIKK